MSSVRSEHQLSVTFQLSAVWPAVAPSAETATTLQSPTFSSELWTIVVNEETAEETAKTLEGVAQKLREFSKKRNT